jgi:hypothetical protein
MGRLTIVLILLVPALGSWSAPALAAPLEAKVGATSIKLVLPPDACQIEKSQPADARYLAAVAAAIAGQNRVLTAYANCGQLADWRAGTKPLLDDHGQYQVSLKLEETDYPAAAVAEVCRQLRQHGDQLIEDSKADQTKRMEQAVKGLKVNEIRSLGVLDEDENGCYSGILQDLHSNIGIDKMQAGVYAISVVKGRMIYMYLYRLYDGPDSIKALTGVVKSTMRDLASVNAQ